jgi:transcriptional regulator GlxA family with amidase domain
MTENFPQTRFSDRLFFVDRDRYTCTGGTAPLHLMLKIIGDQLGRIVASKVSDLFALDRIRVEEDRQYVPLAAHVGHYHENLIEAASLMESNLEDPLGMQEIAKLVGVSRRQIEKLFKRYVGEVPMKYYLELRLLRARSLLLDTSMTVMQVSVACGFQSAPHFSKCYRDRFGNTPTEERCRRPISKRSPSQVHSGESFSFA